MSNSLRISETKINLTLRELARCVAALSERRGPATPFPGFQRDIHRDTLRENTASPTPFSVSTDGESLSNSRRIARVRRAVKRMGMYHLPHSTATGRVVKRARFKTSPIRTPIAAWEPAIRVQANKKTSECEQSLPFTRRTTNHTRLQSLSTHRGVIQPQAAISQKLLFC